jgi:hypothetical protein
MYNYVQFVSLSPVANVSTKSLYSGGMDRSDKENLSYVTNTALLLSKKNNFLVFDATASGKLDQTEIYTLSSINYYKNNYILRMI